MNILPEQSQNADCPADHYVKDFPKGTKVDISGGKWKKKWGYVVSVSRGYSQVEIHDYIKSKAKGDAEDEIKVSVVRVKTPYLKKIVEQVWEMPDAEDLVVVDKLPEEQSALAALEDKHRKDGKEVVGYGLPVGPGNQADAGLCQQLVDAMVNDVVEEQFPVEEALSEHSSEDEAVDISEDLPTIDEAILLKQQKDSILADKIKMIQQYNDARFEVKQLKDELQDQKEHFRVLKDMKNESELKLSQCIKLLDEKDTGGGTRSREKAEKWNKVKALFIDLLD